MSEQQLPSDFESQSFGVGYAVLALFGICGNVRTFVTLRRERNSSWFHMQLALANCMSLTAAAFSSPSALNGRWLFGELACHWYGLQTCFAAFAEIMLTSAICIETMFATCYKEKYMSISKKTFVVLSGTIWAYAAIFALAPLFGWNRYITEKFSVSCGLDLYTTTSSSYNYILFIHGVFMVTVLAACVCLLITLTSRRNSDGVQAFAPIFTDAELVKVTTGLLVTSGLCCLPYYLRVMTFLRGGSPIFRNFLSIEFSKMAMKLACGIQPAMYLAFGGQYKKHVIVSITGTPVPKKQD